jgi:hypothetical protein
LWYLHGEKLCSLFNEFSKYLSKLEEMKVKLSTIFLMRQLLLNKKNKKSSDVNFSFVYFNITSISSLPPTLPACYGGDEVFQGKVVYWHQIPFHIDPDHV